VIWVYAICDLPDNPPPRRRGLAQAPLEGVRHGPLLAVVSRHEQTPADTALDALWVHERVVERLMGDRAVLPMRYGTKLGDDAALRASLAEREGELLAALDRVRGRVELSVRAMQPHGTNGDAAAIALPTTGREYLLSRLHDGRRAEQAAAAVHQPLAALAVAARRWPGRVPGEVLRAAYLVDRAVVPRFRATVERLQRDQPAALLCTGPWPPYSFAELRPVVPA
jgi:Gas vesicle synthesis protein GvpL/GvpF